MTQMTISRRFLDFKPFVFLTLRYFKEVTKSLKMLILFYLITFTCWYWKRFSSPYSLNQELRTNFQTFFFSRRIFLDMKYYSKLHFFFNKERGNDQTKVDIKQYIFLFTLLWTPGVVQGNIRALRHTLCKPLQRDKFILISS